MLNELYELQKSVERAGITTKSWHPRYQPCRNGLHFLVTVDPKGELIDITAKVVDRNAVANFRSLKTGNQKSFPVFNTDKLYHCKTDEHRDLVSNLENLLRSEEPIPEQIHDALEAICRQVPCQWADRSSLKVRRCAHEQAEEMGSLVGVPPEDFEAVAEIIRRSLLIHYEGFHHNIEKLLTRKILAMDADALDCLTGYLVEATRTPRTAAVLLELSDSQRYPYPVNCGPTAEWINSKLLEQDEVDEEDEGTFPKDAFGSPLIDWESKYPKIKMPVLGSMPIRSMNRDIPCLHRYGKIDAPSFPVGKSARQAMKDAMEWLCDPQRNGFTWQNISSVCSGQGTVLCAYPSHLPETPPQMALLLGGTHNPAADEGRFGETAKRVVSSLKGIVREYPEARVNVYVLNKVSKANKRVLMHLSLGPDELFSAAQRWQEGAINLPFIKLNLARGRGSVSVEPATPYPMDLVIAVNTDWIRHGNRPIRLYGASPGDSLALLTSQPSIVAQKAERLLKLLLTRSSDLLAAIGQEDMKQMGKVLSTDNAVNLMSITLGSIGILLHLLGHDKGGYMHSAPFLLGRLLSLVDSLQLQYCKRVRKGKIPSQLVGNSVIPNVLNSPSKGLALLLERIRVYQGWARTSQGEKTALAKWFLGEIGRVTYELSQQTLPTVMNDSDKAELLLGYLARPQREKEGDLNDSENTEKTEAA